MRSVKPAAYLITFLGLAAVGPPRGRSMHRCPRSQRARWLTRRP